MPEFFHGVRTSEFIVGPRQVRIPKTGVVFLVGTAPLGEVNVPKLSYSDATDAALFGPEVVGYTIPAALRALRDEGAAAIVVVNVFDRTARNGDGPPANVSSVTTADIIGGVDPATGRRKGLALVEDLRSLFGFDAKLLIAPEFSEHPEVVAALDVAAERCAGIAFADVSDEATVQQAIEGRGPEGVVDLQHSSTRVFFCYPRVKAFSKALKQAVLEPLSTYAAAAWAAKDAKKGFWWSVSNTKLKSVLGTSRPITAREDDSNCEASLLNAAGILTVFADYGSGFLVWGNRSSAFPSSNDVDTLGCVRRTADVVEAAIQRAGREFVDAPPTKGTVDTILETVNAFMRGLKADGAIFSGNAFLDKTKNPSQDVANGRVVIGYRFMPMPPLEDLEFEAYIDITLAHVG